MSLPVNPKPWKTTMPQDEAEQKHIQIMNAMKELQPLRNLSAIEAWIRVMRPEVSPLIATFIADATKGNTGAAHTVLFMMMAFAAGRAYEEANPDAPRDPDGYQ